MNNFTYDYKNPVDCTLLKVWFSIQASKHLDGVKLLVDVEDLEYLDNYADADFKAFYVLFNKFNRINGESLVISKFAGWEFKEEVLGEFVFGSRLLASQFDFWRKDSEKLEKSLEDVYCDFGDEALISTAKSYISDSILVDKNKRKFK